MADTVTLDTLRRWLHRFATDIAAEAHWLTELDSAIGDADHGTNMVRGTKAVVAKLDAAAPATVPEFFKSVGMTLISSVGGASGPLYGTFFLEMGRHSPTAAELTPDELDAALRAGLDGVVSRGHAEPGDKTMIDALTPALAALTEALGAGLALAAALNAAADAAAAGRDATKPLVARKGRASYLGDRSAGHLDPGAASTAILITDLAAVVAEEPSA